MIKKAIGKIWEKLTEPLPLEVYPKIISLLLLLTAIPVGLVLVKNPARFSSLAGLITPQEKIINLNPTFADGISSWQVFPADKVTFISDEEIAKITLLKPVEELLLLQDNVFLKNETSYQIKITAKSSKPITLKVSLVSENSVVNYGIDNFSILLTDTWSTSTLNFVSQNISSNNPERARLQIKTEDVSAKTEISFSLISLTQLP